MKLGVSYHALVAGDMPCIYFHVSPAAWFVLSVAHPQQKWWVRFKEDPAWAFELHDGSQTVELGRVDGRPSLTYVNNVTESQCSFALSVRGAYRMHRTLLDTPRWLSIQRIGDRCPEHGVNQTVLFTIPPSPSPTVDGREANKKK
jgi:hypothetical protein